MPPTLQTGFTGSRRQTLVAFVAALTKAYPTATVADTLALMLAARRLRSYPEDVADVLATVPHRFPCDAAAGVLTVNANNTQQPCFDEWLVVPTV